MGLKTMVTESSRAALTLYLLFFYPVYWRAGSLPVVDIPRPEQIKRRYLPAKELTAKARFDTGGQLGIAVKSKNRKRNLLI